MTAGKMSADDKAAANSADDKVAMMSAHDEANESTGSDHE
jgi:hypothetical protein